MSRFFVKLLMAFLLVIATSTLILNFTIHRFWEQNLLAATERTQLQKARLFAQRVDNDHDHSPQQMAAEEARTVGDRATIIDRDGKVLADSEADAETMENHAARPEFVAALHGQPASDIRRSHTLGQSFFYAAAPSANGAVRLAQPLAAIEAARNNIRHRLLMASLLACVLALVLAAGIAESISRRLRRIQRFAEQVAGGDLSARIAEHGNDEIGRLALALDKTTHRVEESFSALQTSRQELETLLNSMRDLVVAIARDGRVQWANAGSRRMFAGVRLQAPVVDAIRDPDFLHAVDHVLREAAIQTVRLTSAIPGRTFSATVAPMPNGGAVAVLTDLTALERVEKTRRDFITNVSHELRTPLTSIQGYTETLLDNNISPEETREFLEIIRKNAGRMSRLTEDLLTLARIESREHRFEFHPVLPEALLRDAEQSFREVARVAGIELSIENAPEAILARPVRADQDAIHQIFANLIDNAVKYGGQGGRIQIGVRPVADGDGVLEFFVRDFGPGIASQHLPRLFERFYRVDKTRSRESGGTGLGLAIAKHIVLAHGGEIRVLSELNHGSTFVFTLQVETEAVPQ